MNLHSIDLENWKKEKKKERRKKKKKKKQKRRLARILSNQREVINLRVKAETLECE